MSNQLVLIGAGGHGRVVLDVAREAGFDVAAVVDPRLAELVEVMGLRVLAIRDEDVVGLGFGGWLNGLGANPDTSPRRALAERIGPLMAMPAIIHPRAVVSGRAAVADGAQIMAGAVVQGGASIGWDAVINTGSLVDHDCSIGPHGFIGPGAVLSGAVVVGESSFVGTGAVILPGIVVGARAVVGAGAVVIGDVADGTTVVGCPAKVLDR
jgi:sugar O-acyltransferase (sialic acid O-acetyltransferase NeuD family)